MIDIQLLVLYRMWSIVAPMNSASVVILLETALYYIEKASILAGANWLRSGALMNCSGAGQT